MGNQNRGHYHTGARASPDSERQRSLRNGAHSTDGGGYGRPRDYSRSQRELRSNADELSVFRYFHCAAKMYVATDGGLEKLKVPTAANPFVIATSSVVWFSGSGTLSLNEAAASLLHPVFGSVNK